MQKKSKNRRQKAIEEGRGDQRKPTQSPADLFHQLMDPLARLDRHPLAQAKPPADSQVQDKPISDDTALKQAMVAPKKEKKNTGITTIVEEAFEENQAA